MSPSQQVSRAAIELIERFEGYRRKAARLPDGRWTIGYGHTLSAREGAEVSQADAEALLIYDLMGVAREVDALVYAELTQPQFDALCAFAFSVGLDAFRGSDVLKRVNEGAHARAAFALELWRRVEFEGEKIVVDALVRRRAAEKLLYLTPPGEAWRPAPSAVLKPELDEEALDTAPREIPAEVAASLEDEAVTVTREPVGTDVEPPSQVEAAAEAVSQRLQALFPESEPVTEAEPAAEPPSTEEAVSEPVEAAPAEFAEPLLEPVEEAAPFEPARPRARTGASRPKPGLDAIAGLVLAGLAFFAGGIYWALAAAPGPQAGVFTPPLVGWLAGVAGVAFVAIGVFLVLERMAGAAERRDKRRG